MKLNQTICSCIILKQYFQNMCYKIQKQNKTTLEYYYFKDVLDSFTSRIRNITGPHVIADGPALIDYFEHI